MIECTKMSPQHCECRRAAASIMVPRPRQQPATGPLELSLTLERGDPEARAGRGHPSCWRLSLLTWADTLKTFRGMFGYEQSIWRHARY